MYLFNHQSNFHEDVEERQVSFSHFEVETRKYNFLYYKVLYRINN